MLAQVSNKVKSLLRQMGSILEAPVEPVNYLADDLIIDGAYHIISGAQGVMKSFVALWLAREISANGRIVIYADLENSTLLIKDRFEIVGIRDEDHLRYWGFHSEKQPSQILAGDYVSLAKGLERPVIIIDSLIRFHDLDENRASEMAKVTSQLRKVTDLGATVIVIHHTGKSFEGGPQSNYRGSSEIGAGCDIGYQITEKTDGVMPLLTVKCFKNRFQPTGEFRLLFTGSEFKKLSSEADEERERQVAAIQQEIHREPGIGREGIQKALKAKGLKIGRDAFYKLLSDEEGESWRIERKGLGKHRHYPLTPS